MVYEIIYYYLLYIIGYLQNINVEKKYIYIYEL